MVEFSYFPSMHVYPLFTGYHRLRRSKAPIMGVVSPVTTRSSQDASHQTQMQRSQLLYSQTQSLCGMPLNGGKTNLPMVRERCGDEVTSDCLLLDQRYPGNRVLHVLAKLLLVQRRRACSSRTITCQKELRHLTLCHSIHTVVLLSY